MEECAPLALGNPTILANLDRESGHQPRVDIRARRPRELIVRALGNRVAVLQDDDIGVERTREFGIVRHGECRHAKGGCPVAKRRQRDGARSDVEVGERFVGDQYARLQHQGTRECDSLTHPRAQLVGKLSRDLQRQVHLVQHGGDEQSESPLADLAITTRDRFGDDLSRRQSRGKLGTGTLRQVAREIGQSALGSAGVSNRDTIDKRLPADDREIVATAARE